MTVYDFIETVNEGSDVVYTLFDCNTEEVLMIATDESENATELSKDDLIYTHYADYEIGSMDMWIANGQIHIEFNIEIDEEDEW